MEILLYKGKLVQILETGANFSKVVNQGEEEYKAYTVRTTDLKTAYFKEKTKRPHRNTTAMVFSGPIWDALIENLKHDTNLLFMISVAPSQLEPDNQNDEELVTIASEAKLYPSYDVVFSANKEVEELIQKIGGEAKPFFHAPDKLRLFHGPRKAFYTALRNNGFKLKESSL